MAEFTIDFFSNSQQFDTAISENIIIVDGSAIPIYGGETEVTPKTYSNVVLETDGTRMFSDITVLKVPYYETSNVSGITVYIGGDE